MMLHKDPTNHFNKKAIYAAAFILTILTLSIATADLSSNKNIVQASSVTGIGTGIYWDQTCKNNTNALEWGKITPGSNNNLTIYVKNECNSAVTLLLSSSNYTPISASNYITLSWNYTGKILKTNQVIPIELTLTVSPLIHEIDDFSFTTKIISRGE